MFDLLFVVCLCQILTAQPAGIGAAWIEANLMLNEEPTTVTHVTSLSEKHLLPSQGRVVSSEF